MSSPLSYVPLRQQRLATTTHHQDPTKRLLNQYTLNAITIILLAIFINQPSWCLETTIYTNNNASSPTSDQIAYDQNTHQYNSNNPSKYQPTAYNDAKQSLDTRLKTVPFEQYHQQIQPATTSMNHDTGGRSTTTRLTSSQIMNQSNVRPLVMQQQQSPSANSDSNPTGQRLNRDSDSSLIEGSGDGPVSGSQKHQPAAEFDDTEEGEDDEDEDYDYKDSLDIGSGHINQPSVIKKPPEPDKVQTLGSSQLKKPNSANTDEAYLPFRPATSGKPPTTIAPPLLRPTIRESSEMFPTILQNTTKPNGRAMGSNMTETAVLIEDRGILVQSTTRNPQIIKPSSDDSYTTPRVPKQNLPPIYTTASPSLVPLVDNQLKVPNVQMSTLSPVATKHKLHNNGLSSLSSSKNSSKSSDIDYDYDDENDDEDSDDVSNFEDNEAQVAAENQPNTLNASSISPNKHLPAIPTITTNITIPPQAITTTAMPKPTSTTTTPRPTPNQMNLPHHTTVSKFPAQSYVPTMAPPMLSPSSEGSSDDNDEDDDDSKFEEELEDDDDDDDDVGDDDNGEENKSQPTQSTSKPSPQSNSQTSILPPAPPRWPPHPSQSSSTQTPAYNDFVNEQYPKPETNIHQTTLAQPVHIRTTTQMPSPTVSATSPRVTKTTTPPPTSTSTSTTTTTSTTTPKPSTTTTTSAPPLPPIKPTLAPFFTSSSTTVRPVSIRYATTPRIRTTTTPVTKIPNVMKPHDNSNLPDGDIELTRQIYDKAVEVYQATNKAISAAVEAIWPPSFEVNSVTFEPFLVQPFLFMFVLGAAIIGLVLTMMLVVYIISYQIQPKEEDVSIYSHS